MKNVSFDMTAIQDDLRKLGVILVAGGIVGLTFEKSIDVNTALIAFITGTALILLGALTTNINQENDNE